MATHEYWNDIKSEVELWNKIVGKEKEVEFETLRLTSKIFRDCIKTRYLCIEIGAGVGRLLKHAGDYFSECYGTDVSDPIINFGQRYLNEHWNHACLVKTDGLHIPWQPRKADFIYSVTCFQHMETMEMVRVNLEEIARVLKPGGKCVIQTVMGDPAEVGRYDGVVFKDSVDFALEFTRAGLIVDEREVEDEWIWIRAHKP